MNSRQRASLALNHQEPDRLPMDLGGTAVSAIHRQSYLKLAGFLDLPLATPPTLISETFNTVEPAESVRQQLGVDFVGLRPGTLPRPPGHPSSNDAFTDEWGVVFRRSRGSNRAFFPAGHPLAGADLAAIKTYPMPDLGHPDRMRGLRERAEQLYRDTSYALIADGMWSLLQKAYDLRGMDAFMMDMAMDEIKARTLIDRLAGAILANVAVFLDSIGPYVEVVTVADDLGLQAGPLMSLAMYRRFLKPYHRAIVAEIKKHTNAKIMLHSDGSIYAFLEDLVEVGFEIINPVQASARQMDTQVLKREFGRVLSFWGGVDTQFVLPYGTPEAVAEEVRRRIDDLAPGGGYVLGAVHVIQNDVPPENVCTLFATGRQYGQYRQFTNA